MKTHYHFIIWACERIESGTGNYIENTTVDLVARTAEEALERAKKLLKNKKEFAVRQIIEHLEGACTHSHS